MRSDIGRLVTERERSGSFLPSQKTGLSIPWKGHDHEYDYDRTMSMSWNRLPIKIGRKEFTDVLSPLYRWLDKQVGRPWDCVYSELCVGLDKRKVTHKHVFDHAFQHIERYVYMAVDGRYYSRDGFRSSYPIKGLFVDPKTGLIRRQTPRPATEDPKEVTKVTLGGMKAWEKMKGIWYLVEYREPTLAERMIRGRDPVLVVKRQLGKKQLRALRAKLA
jgi:hypothetical protein